MSHVLTRPQRGQASEVDVAALNLDALNLDALIAHFDAVSSRAQRNDEPVPELHPSASERRSSPRLSQDQLAEDVRLSLAGGDGATLVNVSASGVLLDTTRRLSPGQTVDLFLRRKDERHAFRGVVVRCHLHTLAPRTSYRAAIRFDRSLPVHDLTV
jgi:hypothetical protein